MRKLAILLLFLLPPLLLLLPSRGEAANCSAYSFNLTNGTTADATQVMGNFNTIMSCANNVLAPLVSPSFTTPTLGNASATAINGVTISSTTGTLTIANGKTLTANNSVTLSGTDNSTIAFGGGLTIAGTKVPVFNNSVTFAGTDGTTMTFPATSATVARNDAAQTFTGVQTFSSGPIVSAGQVMSFGGTGAGLNVSYSGGDGTIAQNSSGILHIQDSNNGTIADALTLIGGTPPKVEFPTVSTTASSANAFLDNSSSNNLLRSTSSIRYKTNVAYFTTTKAGPLIDQLAPITYTSLSSADNPSQTFYGFLAEDVAKAEPALVNWIPVTQLDQTKNPPNGYANWAAYLMANQQTINGVASVPDYVQYDRVTTILLAEVKSLRARLKAAGIP